MKEQQTITRKRSMWESRRLDKTQKGDELIPFPPFSLVQAT